MPMTTLREMLASAPWMKGLTPEQRARVEAETREQSVCAAGYVCCTGEPVQEWIGVVDGLVKVVATSVEGKEMTYAGVTTGGWFGEGSLLKDEPRYYDVIALRDSRIAFLPRATFHWLLDQSIPFNRFLLTHINERLGQFMRTLASDRLHEPDARVARCLALLYHPLLSPGATRKLMITQEEIGHLAGLSRQRVNHSLKALEESGLLRIEHIGVTVLDLARLKTFSGSGS